MPRLPQAMGRPGIEGTARPWKSIGRHGGAVVILASSVGNPVAIREAGKNEGFSLPVLAVFMERVLPRQYLFV